MTIRSLIGAGVLSIVAALALGTSAMAQQGDVQAVPRTGLSFPSTVTVRGWVESIDPETRTIVFTTPDGRLVDLAVGDGVRNLEAIPENAAADITYNQIVTLLNLRQKGPGSREARRESASPSSTDTEMGRFTVTVTAIDLANNKVSVIEGRGGQVHTYTANTAAKQELLKKMKIGDVVIGLTSPMQVTAIVPVK
jgi:hypothetical protein